MRWANREEPNVTLPSLASTLATPVQCSEIPHFICIVNPAFKNVVVVSFVEEMFMRSDVFVVTAEAERHVLDHKESYFF